jgi:hypothetical protein
LRPVPLAASNVNAFSNDGNFLEVALRLAEEKAKTEREKKEAAEREAKRLQEEEEARAQEALKAELEEKARKAREIEAHTGMGVWVTVEKKESAPPKVAQPPKKKPKTKAEKQEAREEEDEAKQLAQEWGYGISILKANPDPDDTPSLPNAGPTPAELEWEAQRASKRVAFKKRGRKGGAVDSDVTSTGFKPEQTRVKAESAFEDE